MTKPVTHEDILDRLLTGDDLTNAEAWVTARTPV